MTTEPDDPFWAVVSELGESFTARGWDGLEYRDPTESGHGDWEVFVAKRGEPCSRDPEKTVDVFARFKITTEQAKTMTADEVAKGLATQVAGRSAHEALEWCWFRGSTWVDPHEQQQIEEAADIIRLGLLNGQDD